MKKIVGILAAAAIATSVFAADVSASTKIDGELFSYDGASKSFSLLKEFNGSHVYANPNMTFSVSDDKAGATVKLTTDTDKGGIQQEWGMSKERGKTLVGIEAQTIWFRPVDAVKISLGNVDVALNKESIKWTDSVYAVGDGQERAGYALSIGVDSFSLDIGMQAWNTTWFDKVDGVDDPAIGETFVKAAYSADFGTIGAYVELNRYSVNGKGRRSYGFWEDPLFGEVKDDNGNTIDYTVSNGLFNIKPKDGAIKDVVFAAGYRNNFDGIDLFVNVGGYMDDKFEWIRPEIFIGGNVDAFGYKAFVAPVIFFDSDVKDALDAKDCKAFRCQLLFRVQYALDAATVYARFDDADILAKKFTSEIRIGAEGNLGCMAYDAWLQINTGKGADQDKVNVSLPFQLKVNF